ncbi:hypothetical protein HJFPF1_10008 [Paramyrothecium foliicola]|nr:hypothetical protein HJFPF1_10008 [Paramyrothecium foliicola]
MSAMTTTLPSESPSSPETLAEQSPSTEALPELPPATVFLVDEDEERWTWANNGSLFLMKPRFLPVENRHGHKLDELLHQLRSDPEVFTPTLEANVRQMWATIPSQAILPLDWHLKRTGKGKGKMATYLEPYIADMECAQLSQLWDIVDEPGPYKNGLVLANAAENAAIAAAWLRHKIALTQRPGSLDESQRRHYKVVEFKYTDLKPQSSKRFFQKVQEGLTDDTALILVTTYACLGVGGKTISVDWRKHSSQTPLFSHLVNYIVRLREPYVPSWATNAISQAYDRFSGHPTPFWVYGIFGGEETLDHTLYKRHSKSHLAATIGARGDAQPPLYYII